MRAALRTQYRRLNGAQCPVGAESTEPVGLGA